MTSVLCSISTRGRYDTTLALSIQAVISQTRKVDKLVIFDDNDEPLDMREIQRYRYLFSIMDQKGIAWEVVFGKKQGQHHNHQVANTMGFEWVWRVDDDCIPEPTVLEQLCSHISSTLGGVAGAILTPPFTPVIDATGKMGEIDNEPNVQWDHIQYKKEVDHLHCSFLYRAGIYDYNLALSKVAHREETLFTYGLKQRGYELFVVPDAVTWHLKNQHGGIRTEQKELFDHDEVIFRNFLKYKDYTIVVLDNGMGDHVAFKNVLADIKNPLIFSCWPDIIPGRSIQEAHDLFGDLTAYNIYSKMDRWNWTDSLESAYRKLYCVEL